jgi:regulator of protease activity HflC (stomatin/prohibitin superfamily)
MRHTSTISSLNGMDTALFGWQRAVTIWEHERGLLYRDGRFVRLLEPGYYQFWRWERVSVTKVSLRQTSEVITGQEILTADKIEVRLSLIAQYAVTNPALAFNQVNNYIEQLYQDLQLSLRAAVGTRTLDTLLEEREGIDAALLQQVAPLAAAYGVTLSRVGIRDIILPGQVRSLFLKEVEADRAGRAELIRARHELATARARANTAKILTENPNVVRMQEIDALVTLAGKHGNVVLLPNLADLLVPRAAGASASAASGAPSGAEPS